MSSIDYSKREMNIKIVYYGASFCGKSTSMQHIFDKTNKSNKSNMEFMEIEGDKIMHFDFLPLALGAIRGFKPRFHLHTLPGQVAYAESLKPLLKGVDGIVFVVDSQSHRRENNQAALENLQYHLADAGYSQGSVPMIIQYNKRDLSDIAAIEEMQDSINLNDNNFFETVATDGTGVFDALKAISTLVLTDLKKGG